MKNQNTFLRAEDIAELLQLDKKTVYRLLASGELPGHRIGGTWFTRRQDVDDLIGGAK